MSDSTDSWNPFAAAWNAITDVASSAWNYVAGDSSSTSGATSGNSATGNGPASDNSSSFTPTIPVFAQENSVFSANPNGLVNSINVNPALMGSDPASQANQNSGTQKQTSQGSGEDQGKISDFMNKNGALVFLMGGLAQLGGGIATGNAAKYAADRSAAMQQQQIDLNKSQQEFKQRNGGAMPTLSLNAPAAGTTPFKSGAPTYNAPKTGG